MREGLDEGLDAGAVGYSSGLIYEPGMHARTEELIALAREMSATAASTRRTCATRRRLLDAVREAIRIGEEGGVAVQISHHKASGGRSWGSWKESLALIDEAARARSRRHRRSVPLHRREHERSVLCRTAASGRPGRTGTTPRAAGRPDRRIAARPSPSGRACADIRSAAESTRRAPPRSGPPGSSRQDGCIVVHQHDVRGRRPDRPDGPPDRR